MSSPLPYSLFYVSSPLPVVEFFSVCGRKCRLKALSPETYQMYHVPLIPNVAINCFYFNSKNDRQIIMNFISKFAELIGF